MLDLSALYAMTEDLDLVVQPAEKGKQDMQQRGYKMGDCDPVPVDGLDDGLRVLLATRRKQTLSSAVEGPAEELQDRASRGLS